jgi:hypothetical protein
MTLSLEQGLLPAARMCEGNLPHGLMENSGEC